MLPGQGSGQLPPFMGWSATAARRPTRAGQLPYDGRFMFARLRYSQGVPANELAAPVRRRGFGRAGPPWSHDYPRAERNFMKILDEIHHRAYTGPSAA